MRATFVFVTCLGMTVAALWSAREPAPGTRRDESSDTDAARRALHERAAAFAQRSGSWRIPSETARRAAYRAKLEQPFVSAVGWRRSFDEARREATASDRMILAYFTRSYEPCAACERLEAGALTSAWFQRRSAVFVPYLNIEARCPDAPDQGLMRGKGGISFPYLVLLSPRGRMLASFLPESEADLDDALLLARVRVDLLTALETDAPDAATRASAYLLGALTGRSAWSMRKLDDLAEVPGVDERLLAFYARKRPRLVAASPRTIIEDVLQQSRRDPRKPDVVKPIRDKRIHELYQSGVRIGVHQRPTLQYCDAVICGALDAGDRETWEAYRPAAEAAAARIIAYYSDLGFRYPAARPLAERRIWLHRERLRFVRGRIDQARGEAPGR